MLPTGHEEEMARGAQVIRGGFQSKSCDTKRKDAVHGPWRSQFQEFLWASLPFVYCRGSPSTE